MPGELHWGPFTLQWNMFSWMAAIIVGYGLIHWRLRGLSNPERNYELLNWISNVIFTFLIIWKFGAVLSDISIAWKRPLGLILFNGGLLETYYGLIAASVVMLYGLKKRQISIRVLADLLPWGILGCIITYQLTSLRVNQVNIPLTALAVGVLIGLMLIKPFVLGSILVARRFSVSFGLGLLLLSLFTNPSSPTILAGEQTGAVCLVLVGLFISPILTFIDKRILAQPNGKKGRVESNDIREQENGT